MTNEITDAEVEAFIRAVDVRASGPLGLDEIRAGLAAARRARHATRASRIADLMHEVTTPELHPTNLDPYPATVEELADEIARVVLDLDASGVARGVLAGVQARLAGRVSAPAPAVKVCRQGSHRDGNDTATVRVRYMRTTGTGGPEQCWTVDMCARHAKHIAGSMRRNGWRNVEIMPAGWTPECTHGADCQVHRDANGLHNYDSANPTWCYAHKCDPYACPPGDREGCRL